MTTVFSAIALPQGSRFPLRRPDFFGLGKKAVEDEQGEESKKPIDVEELDATAPDREELDLNELNTALRVLVDVFPAVEPQVFREMLLKLSDESRVEVVTEYLLRDGAKWVRGRFRKVDKEEEQARQGNKMIRSAGDAALLKEDTFRSEAYKEATRNALYQEFKVLSRSTIRAVLAEVNYSYSQARPTLQELASRTWRFTLSNFWTKRRSNVPNVSEAEKHPLVDWQPDSTGSGMLVPYLKRTKSLELNWELYNTLIAPILAKQKEDQFQRDQEMAHLLNDAEAEEADAMYDCECCYTPATFEQIATCDGACHYICFRCIRHAVNEALFGQGWARNIDPAKTAVRCLAPSLDECEGCISASLVQRALSAEKEGLHAWQKLEERVADEALIKSQLPLLRCPFCPYAELDELPPLRFRDPISLAFYIGLVPCDYLTAMGILLFILLYPLLFPLLDLAFTLLPLLHTRTDTRLRASRTRIVHKRRGLKLLCRNVPSCGAASCLSCACLWRDPHTCHENTTLSLRHAIEAATTSSIKRVCPKCNLSFVKASGCNKLVCNCGYTMCYICRCEIGREGYAHFCQHFRDEPGQRCRECDRCDLYVAEDEDVVVRRAAEDAEREWFARDGNAKEKERLGRVRRDVLDGPGGKWGRQGDWDWDRCLDWVMDAVLA